MEPWLIRSLVRQRNAQTSANLTMLRGVLNGIVFS
jgi:hypothetical protein